MISSHHGSGLAYGASDPLSNVESRSRKKRTYDSRRRQAKAREVLQSSTIDHNDINESNETQTDGRGRNLGGLQINQSGDFGK